MGARVLNATMPQVALMREDARTGALREFMGDLLTMDAPRKRIGGMMSGLDIRYDLGDGHPLLGRRMPDPDVITPCGQRRVYSFVHSARWVLMNFGLPGSVDLGAASGRVEYVEAKYDGRWELPVIGEVPAPNAVLMRPDGYVVWVGDGTSQGFAEVMRRWLCAAR